MWKFATQKLILETRTPQLSLIPVFDKLTLSSIKQKIKIKTLSNLRES